MSKRPHCAECRFWGGRDAGTICGECSAKGITTHRLDGGCCRRGEWAEGASPPERRCDGCGELLRSGARGDARYCKDCARKVSKGRMQEYVKASIAEGRARKRTLASAVELADERD